MIAIGMLKACYFLTDTYFVGKLGDDALVALGGTAFAWWMVLLVAELAGTGVHSRVARHVGAGEIARAGATTSQGLWVAALASVGLLLLLPARDLYFALIGFSTHSPEHILGSEYLVACLVGASTFAAHAALSGTFRGLGDTRTALVITAATLLLNALLDPLLIWGLGPIPGLGIAGAAWATSVANALGALLGWTYLRRAGIEVTYERPQRESLKDIFYVGAPVSARGVAFSMVYVLLGRMIISHGSHQIAALGVGHRLESFPYMLCVGFEVGAATLVGQNIGAGNRIGAARATRVAAQMCLVATLPMSMGLYIWAEPLFRFFAERPETIAAGVVYLRIQTAAFVGLALESTYEGAFTGTGNTIPAFWIGAIGTASRIPLAYVLATLCGLGVTGIWWAIALSTLSKGAAMWFWFTYRELGRT
jgi:putative MATE family efflux protein